MAPVLSLSILDALAVPDAEEYTRRLPSPKTSSGRRNAARRRARALKASELELASSINTLGKTTTPQQTSASSETGKKFGAKPTSATPTIAPVFSLTLALTLSDPDPKPSLVPPPKAASSPLMSVAEDVWCIPPVKKSKVAPSEGYGVEQKTMGDDLGEAKEELAEGAKDGVVEELMKEAKKAIRNLNFYKVDPDTCRRHHYPVRTKPNNFELDSFLGRLRLVDKKDKEDRSHEGYIPLGSDDGSDDDEEASAGLLMPEVKDKYDFTKALDRVYEKARAMTRISFDDDEEDRAKKAFRDMYYKKKALSQHGIQQENAVVSRNDEDNCDRRGFRVIYDKEIPLAQQENIDDDEDEEWRPYVPEKDDDEWEFDYYMSLKPVEPWSPIDEY